MSSNPIKTTSGETAKLSFAKKPATTSAWSNVPADGELVDESALLAQDVVTKSKATEGKKANDCSDPNVTKKACKNCSCGRADKQAVTLDDVAPEQHNSNGGCGNCALGDAFRCSGCPYLGQPAFKKDAGSAVKLDL